MTVVVVGAGLAGLVAAATAAEHGNEVVLLEQDERPGGTSVLATGWIWRYRDVEAFARAAPHGDRRLQRAVWDELSDALPWLERCGARVLASGTSNAATDGVRVDIAQVVDLLARRLPSGSLRCGERLVDAREADDGAGFVLTCEREAGARSELAASALVMAAGGYGAAPERIAEEAGLEPQVRLRWGRRNAGLSDGSALDVAVALGARRVPVTGESYVRAMPAAADDWPDDYLHFARLDADQACLVDDDGVLVERAAHDWSCAQLQWQLARGAGSGWYVFDRSALTRVLPHGTVAKAIAEARAAGEPVLEASAGAMSRALAREGVEVRPAAARRIAESVCAVAVRPGITHTMCGLRVDERACCAPAGRRALRRRDAGHPLARLFAAGVEAGGVASGGHASGLAQALALGRVAGREAARVAGR